MQLGMIGLGKMGLNLSLNLQDKDVEVVGFDISESARKDAEDKGLPVVSSLDGLLERLSGERVIMLSTPAGEVTNNLVRTLLDKLNPGDILIDGGNSHYKESVANYKLAQEKNVEFLDCGTSGGMEGARNGACLMVGGKKEVFDKVEEIFSKLACENGYIYAGEAGSGHFLKMVHNGIEYGMMQAIGEGFDVLNASEYDFDFEKVASVWNHGSVIRSWLMELAEESFKQDPNLETIQGVIDSSGEGKWTIETALDLNIPVPVIATSLFVRNASQFENSFSNRVVAMLRHQFGGHAVHDASEDN